MRIRCGSIVFVSLAGCMQPAAEIFPAADPPVVWPLAPETPRIRYLGELRTSKDLHPAKSGWQVVRERLNRTLYRPIHFSAPHAIAVGPKERMYVVDTGSASLHIIDLKSRKHLRINSADIEHLRAPVGVAVAQTSLFVTDSVLRDVLEFDLNGTFKRRLNVQLERPSGIAYCPENHRLYVVDTAAHRCVVLSEQGEQLFSFGQRGAEPGMFNFPTYITYSPLLGLIISDTLNFRVQRFELDGTFVASIGKKGDGAGDFSLPKGVAVDHDGNLYVIDAQFENVQIFREDGQLLLAFGEEGDKIGQFSIPSGIAIDQLNRIWVADSQNRRLQVFQYLSQIQ